MAGREQRTLRAGIIGWFLVPVFAFAELAPVEVDRVSFRTVAEDWWQATVKLRSHGDPSPNAGAPDFAREVELILSVAFRQETGTAGERPAFTFYRSTVRLPALEQGGPGRIPFYLPGVVVQRDRLPGRPFAWVVELSVEGEALPVRRGQFGGEIPTRESYENFLQRARAEAPPQDGWLRPVYRTPARIVASGGIDPRDIPAFVRPGPPP
jgi:hypothetical protein